MAPALNTTGPAKAYIPVKLSNHRGDTIRARALIDTGNTLNSGIAINSMVARKLQLKVEGQPTKVGTASRGQQIFSRGTSEELNLHLPDHPTFKIKPLVFPQLSHDVNVGLQFLREHRMVVDYSQEAPVLRGESGQTTMIATLHPPKEEFLVEFKGDQPVQPDREVGTSSRQSNTHWWSLSRASMRGQGSGLRISAREMYSYAVAAWSAGVGRI